MVLNAGHSSNVQNSISLDENGPDKSLFSELSGFFSMSQIALSHPGENEGLIIESRDTKRESEEKELTDKEPVRVELTYESAKAQIQVDEPARRFSNIKIPTNNATELVLENESGRESNIDRRMVLLPSSSQIYLRTLHTMATALHGRLSQTDTLSLNSIDMI
jgi:hypothetical protein